MRILLHTNALNERGTTVAVRDYAKGLSQAGHEVSIAYDTSDSSSVEAIKKQVHNEVTTYGYSNFNVFARQNAKEWDVAYFMKYGNYDGKLIPKIPNIVHAVFQTYNPHGERYLYISEWLSKKMRIQNLKNLIKLSPKGLDSLKRKSFEFLPYIVSLPSHESSLRAEWGFPDDAIIGGRHGAKNTFDVPMVHRAIQEILYENEKVCFVFANTHRFIEHPRVKFLPTLLSRLETSDYLSSLDFYLHARHRGETFGLSLLEAMSCKVPIFSYSVGVDGNHRYLLKDSFDSLFKTPEQLKSLIENLHYYRDIESNFEKASQFSSKAVIQKWNLLLSGL